MGPSWASVGLSCAPVGPNWGPFGNAAWEVKKKILQIFFSSGSGMALVSIHLDNSDIVALCTVCTVNQTITPNRQPKLNNTGK